LIAHKFGKITHQRSNSKIILWASLSAIGGLLFNVIFDPLVGYYYKLLILGKPAAELALVWNVTTTSVNAVLSGIAAVALYMPLCHALKRAGMFMTIGDVKED